MLKQKGMFSRVVTWCKPKHKIANDPRQLRGYPAS